MVTSSMASSIISFSSIPFIPILISRICAPISSCSSAMSQTISMLPWRSDSCSSFFPVGLMRSPITRNGPLISISCIWRSEAKTRLRSCITGTGFIFFVAATREAMCSGVVPQHPPSTAAPASINIGPKDANSSGPIS